MKKTYISPMVQLSDMELEQMIAFSVTEGVDLEHVETTDETSGNLSRRSVWDDEELNEEGF